MVEKGNSASEETLESAILTMLPHGVLTYSVEGECKSANEAAANLLGSPRERLFRQNFREIPVWKNSGLLELAEETMRTGRPRRLDMPCIPDSGVSQWLDFKLTRVNMDGEANLLVILEDVTEHKRVEDLLRASEQRYRCLFDNASEGIIVHDLEGLILEANDAITKRLGSSSEDLVGMNVMEICGSEASASWSERMVEVRRQGRAEFEMTHRRRDGTAMSVEVSSHLIQDAGGEIVLNISRDFTEHTRAKEALLDAVTELERSNWDLEQFARVVSHDLQEPLRMVESYTQLLAQRYENQLDDKAQKYIHYAVDGAARMQRLINDLLTYSRVATQGQVPEPVDSGSVLDDALRNLSAVIEESGATVTSGHLPQVRADATQLLQVFQNVIANAIKFHGGDSPEVHVLAREEDGEWLFSVKDNGIGIDAQHAYRVFTIFQRLHTRDEYPGTGVGLAVCKRIVERHGGRIWFESKIGKGSTFFFTLPR